MAYQGDDLETLKLYRGGWTYVKICSGHIGGMTYINTPNSAQMDILGFILS